jgi:hypothetical protein
VEAREGGERSFWPCLSYLLKLQLKAINNKRKGGRVATCSYNPRTKKKKQGEEEEGRKEEKGRQ